MRPPRPLPPEFANRPFGVRAAIDAGVHPERLRRADLVAPFVGTRVPAHSRPTMVELCAALQELRPGSFVSHLTAARLFDLPLPLRYRDDALLDLAVFDPERSPRLEGVRGHHLSPHYTSLVDCAGLRVASPVSTWRQLARVLTRRELVVIGDSLLRRQDPRATIEQLRAAVETLRGVPGYRRLYGALLEIRPRTDSGTESELRMDLVAAGLPEPEVNPPIFDSDGHLIGYGDLVFREQKVIVEYDGEQHRTDQQQYSRDVDRLNALARDGWLVIRVNRSHRGAARRRIIHQIGEALVARGWEPMGRGTVPA